MTGEEAMNLLMSAYGNEVIKGGRGCGKTAFRTALLMGANAIKVLNQLENSELDFNQKIDYINEVIERDKYKPLVNYDNCGNKCISMRCPNCFEMVGSSIWKYCPECGQRIEQKD